MYSHDTRAALDRQDGGRDGRRSALADLTTGCCAEHRLARNPDQQRPSDPRERAQLVQQRVVVYHRLAKPEARIDDDALGCDTRQPERIDALSKECRNLAHHVVIAGFTLHGAGHPLHVHDDDAAIGRCHRLGSARLPQRTHVVDDRCAGCQSSAHDRGLAGIDRYRNAAPAHRLDQRHHPPDFLLLRHVRGAGPGRLAADIEQVGPFVDQAQCMSARVGERKIAAPIGERIGRDVDHTHDQRTRQI